MFAVPELFAQPDDLAAAFRRHLGSLGNPSTRRAHLAAADDLSAWCMSQGIRLFDAVNDQIALAYIQAASLRLAPASVRQRVSCVRRILHACRSSQTGSVPAALKDVTYPRVQKWHAGEVMSDATVARIVQSCGGASVAALRDRALIAMLYVAFPPIESLRRMSVGTFVSNPKGKFLIVGRGDHQIPCGQRLAHALETYLAGAGLRGQTESLLFRSIAGASGRLSEKPLSQPDIYRIVQRRAKDAGIAEKVSPRQVRASGLVAYLRNGGELSMARDLAGHGSRRVTVGYAKPGTKLPPKIRFVYRWSDLDDLDDEELAKYDYGDWDDDDGYVDV